MRWLAALVMALTATSALSDIDVEFHWRIDPARGVIDARIKADYQGTRLRALKLATNEQYSAFTGDGSIERDGDQVIWEPPEDGGELNYTVVIDNPRGRGTFDARMTRDWALFRGDDVVPPATTVVARGEKIHASLHVDLPPDWSIVTPYREKGDNVFPIRRGQRLFDRPIGWMIAGDIGVRIEDVAGVRVKVAGPKDQNVRRMDIVAFLNWNLPALLDVFPDFADRLLIVSAADGMWRGGLSAPNSIYLHAERPLISGNGTSSLLHELVHVASGLTDEQGSDWIVEGIAEFYSLTLMHRTGTISNDRYDTAMADLKRWGAEADALDQNHASGEVTARAVQVFKDLDEELRKKSKGEVSLDDVVRALSRTGKKVNLEDLRRVSQEVSGLKTLKALADKNLPGIG